MELRRSIDPPPHALYIPSNFHSLSVGGTMPIKPHLSLMPLRLPSRELMQQDKLMPYQQ